MIWHRAKSSVEKIAGDRGIKHGAGPSYWKTAPARKGGRAKRKMRTPMHNKAKQRLALPQ
jgi:hypothetical protein